jgi:CHASE3 domain sensor protein
MPPQQSNRPLDVFDQLFRLGAHEARFPDDPRDLTTGSDRRNRGSRSSLARGHFQAGIAAAARYICRCTSAGFMPISKLAFVRSTVLAILVGLAALLLIVGFNLWLASQARVYSDIVTAARQERSAIVDLRNMLDDTETGQRGYLLTGEQPYLAPYSGAVRLIPAQIDKLRQLTSDDTVQVETLAKLLPAISSKLAELRETIDQFDSGRRDEALALVKASRGKEAMDQARQYFGTMLERAESNLTGAVREEQQSIETLQWVTVGGALVILLVVGGSVWTVLLYTRQLIAAQREVATLNVGLEERVRERTADLGRANEEIQRFAYIVTHDLRAPLVNVMGFTSELEGSLGAIQSYVKQSDTASEDEAVKKAREAALEDLPEADRLHPLLHPQDGWTDQCDPQAVARGPARAEARTDRARCSSGNRRRQRAPPGD